MNRKSIYFISLALFIATLFSCSSNAKLRRLQKCFIPDVVSNVYLGMSLKQLKEARGIVNISVTNGDAVTIAREGYTKDSITLITYQFDKTKTLYELIIEYAPELKALDIYQAKYGAMNNGKEWLFTLSKDLKLKVWIYQNRLCIADSKHFKN